MKKNRNITQKKISCKNTPNLSNNEDFYKNIFYQEKKTITVTIVYISFDLLFLLEFETTTQKIQIQNPIT